MAAAINSQIAGMSTTEFAALPPHIKLRHSTKLPNSFLMNHAAISRRRAQRLGLTVGNAAQIFQPVHMRVVPPTVVAKRPLNSWMAFRAFYAPIFASLQQKNASTHLTALWQRDPFKAKWAILARAYSAIRDKVGKPRAPLDRFFIIVCPELGIISADEYLEKMCWTVERNLEGIMTLAQTSAPDIASFDDHIINTIMTEKDVAHYCGQRGYISQSAAASIVGLRYNPANGAAAAAASQQGLLASAPVLANQAQSARPSRTTFIEKMVEDPVATVSAVMGFNIGELVGNNNALANAPPYEWTGCMADLYNPNEGSFNFGLLANDYATSAFDCGEISDPRSFDIMFGEVIQDGFQQFPVPESYNAAAGI